MDDGESSIEIRQRFSMREVMDADGNVTIGEPLPPATVITVSAADRYSARMLGVSVREYLENNGEI